MLYWTIINNIKKVNQLKFKLQMMWASNKNTLYNPMDI